MQESKEESKARRAAARLASFQAASALNHLVRPSWIGYIGLMLRMLLA